MGQIKVLDENMINMIAAGEVIERPGSVVKELLENSIDAGATKITIRLEDGGGKLISITDNGCGMDADDLAVAFEAHATSKLKTAADLLNISTMGFRGEALASIGAVARVSIVSRISDAIEANKIENDCGQRSPVRPTSADYGTTVEVRDLFYKLPGRKKFLRTANTEIGHISEQFIRIALANCCIDMTLIHNNRELHRLTGGQDIAQRINNLFPRQLDGLIAIHSNEKDLTVTGLIGRGEHGRVNSKYQYIFLNGRYIHDKFISHAIKEAYRGVIEPDKFPVVFLFLKMPCHNYDVNVHPTKIEVRFDNSNLLHSQILAVLRQKLLSLDLDVKAQLKTHNDSYTDFAADNTAKNGIAQAIGEFFQNNRPLTGSQQRLGFSDFGKSSDNFVPSRRESFYEPSRSPEVDQDSRKYLQLHNSFIVAQTDDGFIIIDQHALHERIIYESLCRKITASQNKGLESQKLLIPESFEVTQSQSELLKTNSELLKTLGIEIESFGPDAMAVQAFPTLLSKVNPVEFMQDLIDMLSESAIAVDAERLLHKILDMAACKAAVKAGQSLSEAEIQQLLADKSALQRASRCPHGRPTTITFTLAELEKQFKRT